MAVRYPVVLVNGLQQQLQSGDSLGGLSLLLNYANASPNVSITYAYLTLSNSDTNSAIALVPKGTGGFALALPDSTTTGGNVRGANSVDLQMFRSNANQVANGQYAFAAGATNIASAARSIAIGWANLAQAQASVSLGQFNTCVSTAVSGFAMGYNTVATQYAERVHGVGVISAGDNQRSDMQLYAACTVASTPYVLTADQIAASATNQIPVPLNTAIVFWGYVNANQKGANGTNFVGWKIEGMAQRGASGNVALVGTPTITALGTVPTGWALTIQADTTNQTVQLVFNMGSTTMNIHATASVTWSKNLYA